MKLAPQTGRADRSAGRRTALSWRPLALLLGALLFLVQASPAAAADTITTPDGPGSVGQYSSLALDDLGNPVVAYLDSTNRNLKLLHCDDPNCEGDESANIATPDSSGTVGGHISLVLDANGNPVVAYLDSTNRNLKLLRCDDPNCEGNESTNIATPDSSRAVGGYISLVLDALGNPVVSYYEEINGNLNILHCDDPKCTGIQSITSPDTVGDVGQYSSLALDAVGNPVVSYRDFSNENLKILHCDDPRCEGSESGNISSPDTDGNVGGYTSLVLDGGNPANPVVSYFDFTENKLKILHCDDPKCADNESGNIASPDPAVIAGLHTSLVLDGDGNPVVSYMGFTGADLKLLHCDDPDCAGDETANITSPDAAGDTGLYTSLALDSDGNPVVSYHTLSGSDLKILHCDDPNCRQTATVEIVKQVINGAGSFDLLLGPVPPPVVLAGAVSGDSTGPITVGTGTIAVGESFADPDAYVSSVVCHDQDGNQLLNQDWTHINGQGWFEMTLEADDEVLCTITNVFIPEECQGMVFDNVILGTGGRDLLVGTTGRDLILGFAGDDYINGRGGVDCLDGGAGDDRLRGSDEAVLLPGGGSDITSTPGGGTDVPGDDDDAGGGNGELGQDDSDGGGDGPPSNDDGDDDRPSRRSRR